MNKNEWNKTATEQNAKAEQTGMAIALIWFFSLFILLPLAIMFPPIIFVIIGGLIWVFMRMKNNNKK